MLHVFHAAKGYFVLVSKKRSKQRNFIDFFVIVAVLLQPRRPWKVAFIPSIAHSVLSSYLLTKHISSAIMGWLLYFGPKLKDLGMGNFFYRANIAHHLYVYLSLSEMPIYHRNTIFKLNNT